MSPASRNRRGVFVFNRMPATAQPGQKLQVWVDLNLGTEVEAEGDVTFEVVGIARVAWIVRPDSQFALDQDRMAGKSRRVQSEDEFWIRRAVLTHPKTFEKGNHSYIQTVKLEEGLFPSFHYKDPQSDEEFTVRYIVRARLPSRDDPIELDKPIEILPKDLPVAALSPLVVNARSPRGLRYSLRARRGQWIPGVQSTLFYSLSMPAGLDASGVQLDLVQRVGMPGPQGSAHRVGLERSAASYSLPGCSQAHASSLVLKLQLPASLPPSMALGPIDVSYEVRATALLPPPAPGYPPTQEVLAAAPIFMLPSVQRVAMPQGFDDVDEAAVAAQQRGGQPPPARQTLTLAPRPPAPKAPPPPPPQAAAAPARPPMVPGMPPGSPYAPPSPYAQPSPYAPGAPYGMVPGMPVLPPGAMPPWGAMPPAGAMPYPGGYYAAAPRPGVPSPPFAPVMAPPALYPAGSPAAYGRPGPPPPGGGRSPMPSPLTPVDIERRRQEELARMTRGGGGSRA
ncbi:hypothetical protein HK405_013724 [Cladochytrium tenue]|nr:hypothetical protein HK405_013724 [Cladochytrium tenue]